MKTFEQLTPEQQAKAVEKCLANLLEAICEGAIRFNDEANQDDLQKRIDAAFAKAEKMRTPWFAHEYILDTCREDLEGMARCDAEDALYSEPGERVIRGIAA
jgi:hypothetical protein